jgi:hypothetical protein
MVGQKLPKISKSDVLEMLATLTCFGFPLSYKILTITF